MNTDLHFSSASEEWATPQDLFDRLNKVFNFELDPCANSENAKCSIYCDKEMDGLQHEWHTYERVFVNPPYGEPEHPCKPNCKKKRCKERGFCNKEYVPGIIDWMRKAYEESEKGALVVCLVPARPDTRWWHEYATKGDVKFLKGRLKFGGCKNAAPFPSAIVIFYPKGTF